MGASDEQHGNPYTRCVQNTGSIGNLCQRKPLVSGLPASNNESVHLGDPNSLPFMVGQMKQLGGNHPCGSFLFPISGILQLSIA